MYFIIFIIVFCLFLEIYLNSAKHKGKSGENKVKRILGSNIDNKKYIFNNYVLSVENNKTIQIDHIVVSTKGIIIIETKNYSGNIYGSENQQQWVQSLQYGHVKNNFYNPIKQNNSHCYHIRKLIGNNVTITPIVVFAQNNKPSINSDMVLNLDQLKQYLISLPNTLTETQVKEFAHILEINNHSDTLTNHQHVKNIKRMQKNVDKNICPRCGGKLILKNGQYGNFYGCENYPSCKFTKKM